MSIATPEPQVAARRYTPDDLLDMDDAVRFELVNGELVERNVSTESSAVAACLIRILGQHVESHNLGYVMEADCSYRCFRDVLSDQNRIRKPDVSFIAAGRLTREQFQSGHTPVAPDLAVEVVSPNDKVKELDEKIEEYRAAGVRLIWVIHPETRTVNIYGPGNSFGCLGTNDELDGEDVVPEFRCRVVGLFPQLPADTAATEAGNSATTNRED